MTMAVQRGLECGGCGRSFQGVAAFDRHRRLGRCVLDGEWWSQDRDGIWHWLPGEYRSAEQWLALVKAKVEKARLAAAGRFGRGQKEGGE